MKKIYLEITPFFPTEENFRGPYVYDQIKAIKYNSDYDVIVIKLISFYEKVNTQQYVYQGIKVYNFRVLDFPSSILPGLFQTLNLYRLKYFIKNIVKIKMSNIKFIHSHVAYPAGALAVDVGMEYSIKNFVQHHGLDVMQLENGRVLKGKLKELNNRFIKNRFIRTVNHTDLNIGVSHKVIEQLENIKKFSNYHTYVLYNGVDSTKFYPKKSVVSVKEFTIGCIGNFWPIKDQIVLLKALKILIKEGKTLQVKFVGSGPTLQTCIEYVEKNHLKNYVVFLSEIDHTELNDFYNTLDLFVLPSYYEAFGCVYTEALQVNVPIIAVRGQGIEEILRQKDLDMFLIEKGNDIQLAKKITYQMNNIRKYEYDFNIDIFINDFLQKIKDMS